MKLLIGMLLYLVIGFACLFITALKDPDEARELALPIVCVGWVCILIWGFTSIAEYVISAAARCKRK